MSNTFSVKLTFKAYFGVTFTYNTIEYNYIEQQSVPDNNIYVYEAIITTTEIINILSTYGERTVYIDNLISVIIPYGVTSIGNYAFSIYSSLTSIVIPDSVISIGYGVFFHCRSLTSIVIPDSVTSIGIGAFSECRSLTSIVIPYGVTSISNQVFESCRSLTSIVIPDSVTSIGNGAFYWCSALTSVVIPDSVTSIGNYAFYWCSALTSIVIPDSVTSIGNGVFQFCSSLTSIVIPNSVTSICRTAYSVDGGAFAECSSLTSIVIPDSVTSIGIGAFFQCSALTSIVIPYGVTSISKQVFESCSALTSIVIPDSVTSIGLGAFTGCSSLTSIVIPDSVTSIGLGAFSGCSSLTSIVIPDSVTSIPYDLFGSCSALAFIVIPNNITSINETAFKNCANLTSIRIRKQLGEPVNEQLITRLQEVTSVSLPFITVNNVSLPPIIQNVVYNDTTNKIIITYTPGECDTNDSVQFVEYSINGGNWAQLTSNEIEYDTTEDFDIRLRQNTVMGFSGPSIAYTVIVNNLDTLVLTFNTDYGPTFTVYGVELSNILSGGTESVYKGSFANIIKINSDFLSPEQKTTLVGIIIPGVITNIGNYTFRGCSLLTSCVIPNGVTIINQYAFYGCSSLSSIVIPNSVTIINQYAFYGCSSLTSIVIPNSVTIIYPYAFYGCSRLATIFMYNTVDIADNAFTLTSNSATFHILVQRLDEDISVRQTLLLQQNPTATITPMVQSFTPTITLAIYDFKIKQITIQYIPGLIDQNDTILYYEYSTDGVTWEIVPQNNEIAYNAAASTGSFPIQLRQYSQYSGYSDPSEIFQVIVVIPCFKKDTKILTNKGYRRIQDIRKGDMVFTYKHGFKAVHAIGYRNLHHHAISDKTKNQLYRCSRSQYPELFEDLIITGCHSILMGSFTTYEQVDKTAKVLGKIYMTDGLYRIPACVDDRTTVYEIPGEYTIYHLALKNDDYYSNYGIYANGLLVETCSKRYLKELSNMTLIK